MQIDRFSSCRILRSWQFWDGYYALPKNYNFTFGFMNSTTHSWIVSSPIAPIWAMGFLCCQLH
ncbi:MAG: hypothetical protein EBS09_03275 [Flavobacteriia bacterium]|nr:hypothetical protein [Flavobacteriia bacterium]NBV68546.1 hypothetical protein [Flavobacteriia bacterium]NBY40554.1 hypothetical protein [Flavobacteriia bacterium]